MRNIILTITYLLAFNFSTAKIVINPDPGTQKSLFDMMSYQEILEVNLELELKKLLENRRSNDNFKAHFSFQDQEGTIREWKTKVKLRGKFRRVRCNEMPPLKLNFKKGDLVDAGLASHDDFKLVTHCVEDEALAKEILLKEYLAYKIYNQITDYSYRVQLLRINFKDTQSGEITKQWGFLIEDTAQLRDRIKGEKYDNDFGITEDQIELQSYRTMALFQYMIGNADWSLFEASRNIKLIKKGEKLLSIPYDFDFAGLVDAPYAKVPSKYQLKSVKERVYLGGDIGLEDFKATKKLFRQHKKEIIRLIIDFDLLDKSTRKSILRYIRSFYINLDELRLPPPLPQ